MHVAVGSTNPVKVAAVERALERYEPTVSSVDVDSGVAEQPRSVAETIDGAETRARRALESGAEYGVGLEGGVATIDTAPGLYLIMWAAVTDGDRTGRGAGPSLALPERIAGRLDDGAELGPVMDEYLGTTGIARDAGAVGALTDGLIDRTDALAAAVACAAAPFVTSHYE
ncbi:inosine/xanthosine triphosphatase [Natrononativus amylolyticus]|uniref:inosine/xanthosine triphosphatase n=1 Tax=Natrononativus amylolyticus TaxID=2963434 RepID=UPI0020CCA288|nr:inosine/xanthosine triphosphatase [Natrononativus amylolyticus]